MITGTKKKPKKPKSDLFLVCFIIMAMDFNGKQGKEKVYSFVSVETSFFLLELISAYCTKKLNAAAAEVATVLSKGPYLCILTWKCKCCFLKTSG